MVFTIPPESLDHRISGTDDTGNRDIYNRIVGIYRSEEYKESFDVPLRGNGTALPYFDDQTGILVYDFDPYRNDRSCSGPRTGAFVDRHGMIWNSFEDHYFRDNAGKNEIVWDQINTANLKRKAWSERNAIRCDEWYRLPFDNIYDAYNSSSI